MVFQIVGNSQMSRHFSPRVVVMLYQNNNNNNNNNNNSEVNGSYHRSRPKKRWFDISTSLALDRVKWRNAIKSSRHVAESNPCCRGKGGR